MSLCDKCFAPGACCKNLFLSRGSEPRTVWLGSRDYIIGQLRRDGLPFEPAEPRGRWIDEASGSAYGAFTYSCPKLEANGRCGDYENRPDVCSGYVPRSDALCVHFHGEAGDPTVEMGIL